MPRKLGIPRFILIAAVLSCPLLLHAQAHINLQPCSNSLSPSQQISLGQQAAQQQVYGKMPILSDSSPVTRYVQSIGQKLAAQAPGYKWPFNFHVVNVADINAFALPGGPIFVNLGTLQAAEDEAQLAAVMAHEISHVVLQHSVCNMEKQKRVGIISSIGQLAAGVLLGGGALSGLAQEGIQLGTGLDFLKMSRGDEQQADELGATILYNAGYDPRAMPQFFEIIKAKYGNGGSQFLSDHPDPGNRTEYIDREIATFPPRAQNVTTTPQFKQIHQIVAGMRAYTAKEVASGVWKQQGPQQTVSTGVNQYQKPAGAATRTVDTAPPSSWKTYQGNGFTMQVPGNWQGVGDQNSAMIAPPGGITQRMNGQPSNIIDGVLTDVYQPQGQTGTSQAFSALLNELTQENPGMQPGQISRISLGGQSAEQVQSMTRSADNGQGEHDWIIGVPMNGALRYFVFVAPESQFNAMRPTFEHILNSVALQ